MEKLKNGSEGQFEGGSNSNRSNEQKKFKTIDEKKEPIYKLNIKNINKGSLKPSKLSKREEEETPKKEIKKQRIIVSNPAAFKMKSVKIEDKTKVIKSQGGTNFL